MSPLIVDEKIIQLIKEEKKELIRIPLKRQPSKREVRFDLKSRKMMYTFSNSKEYSPKFDIFNETDFVGVLKKTKFNLFIVRWIPFLWRFFVDAWIVVKSIKIEPLALVDDNSAHQEGYNSVKEYIEKEWNTQYNNSENAYRRNPYVWVIEFVRFDDEG